MNLLEMTKKYSAGKGEGTMWKTVAVISDAVDNYMNDEQRTWLMRRIYSILSAGHYNEEFAHEDMAKLFYTDANGDKRVAPYWTDAELKAVYDSISDQIPDVPFWDFAVALNMMKSDEWDLLRYWFPNATEKELTDKLVESTINWLNDEDSPQGAEKTWHYMNMK